MERRTCACFGLSSDYVRCIIVMASEVGSAKRGTFGIADSAIRMTRESCSNLATPNSQAHWSELRLCPEFFYKTNRTAKDRLTTLSREVFSGRSIADDTAFWGSWLRDCNQKRNAVVHRGEEIGSEGAKRLVNLCEDCISRFAAL